MTSSFMEYFAKYTAHLDSAAKGTLTSAHFSNITAALLLTEELMSECDESQQNEMKHAISAVPGIASAASLILEHINDEGRNLSYNGHLWNQSFYSFSSGVRFNRGSTVYSIIMYSLCI